MRREGQSCTDRDRLQHPLGVQKESMDDLDLTHSQPPFWLNMVKLTGGEISGSNGIGKSRLCSSLTVITKRLEHFRKNIDAQMIWHRSRRSNLERSVLAERLNVHGCHRRNMLPMQLESDKRRRSKVYRIRRCRMVTIVCQGKRS